MTEEDDSRGDHPRKNKREAIQIYRPGMFKKGVDSTLTGEPSTNSKPPEVPRKMRISTSPLGSARSTGRIDQVHRRRSNDTDSVHSYRNDSGSTTPDAMSIASERKNSWGGGRGGAAAAAGRVFSRGGGGGRNSTERNNDAMSEFSAQSFRSSNTRNEPHTRNEPRYERNDYRNNQRRGPERREDNQNGYGKPTYNSTQSLYNSRLPGGYLDSSDARTQRGPPLKQNLPPAQQRFNRNGPGNERSSLRSERRPRRRNDSMNSTQSEWPQPTQELHVDTGPETQSQAGDALSTTSVDYFAVCQSLESMGSFNWTEEMEEVERKRAEEQRQREEEENQRKLQQKLEACKSGIELQKALNENKGRPIRGIMRINIDDGPQAVQKQVNERQQSPRGGERPPPHPRGSRNRNKERQRRDSGSSSVSSSIVEEEENDDQLASGERTPTDSRPSSSQGHRDFYRAERRGSAERMRSRGDPQPERTSFLPSVPQNSRLAGRLTISNGVQRTEARGVYQPPAMRRATDPVGSATLKSNRDRCSSHDNMFRKTLNKEDSVYYQFAHDEMQQIEKLNQDIGILLPQVADKKDVKSAQKLLTLSDNLRTIYLNVLTKDVNFSFSKNMEQHLWKQAFHKIIDAMKRGSNSVNSNAKNIRSILLQFIDEGITFYMLLISHIETTFDVSFEMALHWPTGTPNDDFVSLVHGESPVSYDGSSQKLALKSLSRHLLCLGDLYRYKSLVEGNEDYSAARGWYLKAAQLWPSSGHTYNQLAVVAYYSMLYTSTRRARHTPLEILSKQRQERVLDEIFFCVRAIGADHPYEAARDRLNGRLAAMRKKVEKYEELLDSEQGRIKTELVEIGVNQREHWISPLKSKKSEEPPAVSPTNASQLHRRAVCYLIHTAGLLISKIGMEKFNSVSERAFSQLSTLISLEDAPISSHQLIQFSALFIYAVHTTTLKGEEGTLSVQQQYAVDTLVTYYGVLLKSLISEDIKTWFSGEAVPSKRALRVLPAISLISVWFQNATAVEIYKDMPSVRGLSFSEGVIDTWQYLSTIVNDLVIVENSQQLAEINLDDDFNTYIQPELMYLASFMSVYPRNPEVFGVNLTSTMQADIPLHVRGRTILQAAKFIVGLHLECLKFDEVNGKYKKVELNEDVLAFTPSDKERSSTPDNLTREELIARERDRRILLVIKPYYVVPDTNAIIDHLSLFKRIVENGEYQFLLPTIVLDELLGLSKPGTDARSMEIAAHAKKAIAWLKDKVKEKDSNMHTLTTQGNKMPMRIATEETDDRGLGKVNDDRILQSCVNYINRNPCIPIAGISIPKGTEPIYCNLVLLSEDRGICIKATSQQVPTKTIQGFAKWTKLS